MPLPCSYSLSLSCSLSKTNKIFKKIKQSSSQRSKKDTQPIRKICKTKDIQINNRYESTSYSSLSKKSKLNLQLKLQTHRNDKNFQVWHFYTTLRLQSTGNLYIAGERISWDIYIEKSLDIIYHKMNKLNTTGSTNFSLSYTPN